MGEGMKKFEVLLKRKDTLRASEMLRSRREEVFARNIEEAGKIALAVNDNSRYFKVDRVMQK